MNEEFVYEEHGNKKKFLLLFLFLVVIIVFGLFLYKRYMFAAKAKVVNPNIPTQPKDNAVNTTINIKPTKYKNDPIEPLRIDLMNNPTPE